MLEKLKNLILGRARSLNDPHIFHKLSLIAFVAWVGLGSDGLSSSCYGPEEAFLALGGHMFLGIFVALATAVTIFIISSSYSQIIELFPSGGGGYLVASKLLSPSVGMVSGCALLVDYVLTITLSVASGADALFSFFPSSWYPFRLEFAIFIVFVLIVLNMRGVKESVIPLIPIFLAFMVTHIFAIIYIFVNHLSDFGAVASTTITDVRSTTAQIGLFGMLALIMRSYSMGAGTYTGIEAVSNGVSMLREPKVKTAKKTMRYMSMSLAFMVVGLMMGYLFYRVGFQPGKTLNAVLFEQMTSGWAGNWGNNFVVITLISEAVLLFVAAQTGFLDGPRVLANMAKDRWFPAQFALLSERFVTQNGILLMGAAGLILMIISRGSVKFLIVLYSINVFITFLLSQAGMVRHWWNERKTTKGWRKKILVNAIGLILTGFILCSMVIIKFKEGGWLTIFITGSIVALAIVIKRHYKHTLKHLKRLNNLISVAEVSRSEYAAKNLMVELKPDLKAKTAVILVNGYNGLGLHTLFNVIRLFGDTFKNFLFVEVGVMDAGNFKGIDEVDKLKESVKHELNRYVDFMRAQGKFADGYFALGTDVVDEAAVIAKRIHKDYPKAVFFGGQMAFSKETFFTKLLHNQTTFAIQSRLHHEGIPFLIMPIKVH
ncbi:MAG: APC family permease [Candidatus Omnitrophota bacterium]